MYTCNNCTHVYKTLKTLHRHKCIFNKYDIFYRSQKDFALLLQQFDVNITILILQYKYVPAWSETRYWLQKWNNMQMQTRMTYEQLNKKYRGFVNHFKWFLFLPLYVIGNHYNLTIRVRYTYTPSKNPLILSKRDHELLTKTLLNLLTMIDDISKARFLSVPFYLTTPYRKWNKIIKPLLQ
jgi:hypothetical protein